MSKNNKNNYSPKTIDFLHRKYGFGMNYIRACIRGDRTGLIPKKIADEYHEIESQIDEIIKAEENAVRENFEL
ncbi:MAG: hypothetical protein M9892_07465 [Bacteroidetes bacterium]|nr:hypothetical protein [Bacteroidota bacterium]